MKVLVLTSETPGNVWLVNQFLARHEIAGMVIERHPLAITKEEKRRRRRQMLRRYGPAKTLNKLLLNLYRSRGLDRSASSTAQESFFPGGAPVAYLRQVPTAVVESVNDPACIEFIRRLAPDLLAVCGTGVIRPEVFSLAPRGAVNMHTGITPEYKSAEPIFWALYRGEPKKVGVTIHFVDRGIDTGPIIHQSTVPVYADDSLATISARCIRRGAELFSRALSEIEAGSVRTLERRSAESRSFRSIDLGIVQHLLFRMRWRRLARRLPASSAANPGSSPTAESEREK